MRLVSDTVELLLGNGLRIEIVSTAGTGTCLFAADWPHVTEVQPGSYVVMDSDYGQVQGLGFGNALTVLTTVLSRRGNDVIVAVDETPVGVFVEIEGSEGGITAMAAAMDRSPADYILDSYRGLFLKHLAAHGLTAADMVFDSSQ